LLHPPIVPAADDAAIVNNDGSDRDAALGQAQPGLFYCCLHEAIHGFSLSGTGTDICCQWLKSMMLSGGSCPEPVLVTIRVFQLRRTEAQMPHEIQGVRPKLGDAGFVLLLSKTPLGTPFYTQGDGIGKWYIDDPGY